MKEKTDKYKPVPLRVGITLPQEMTKDQALWGSGLVQNAVFLYRTLALIPGVRPLMLGSFSLAKSLNCEWTSKGPGYLDVVVEASSKLDPKSGASFRAFGGKVVHFMPGNSMFLNMEHVTGSHTPGLVPDALYDAVWLLPHVAPSSINYWASVWRSKVEIVPIPWSPEFMAQDWPMYEPQARKVVGVFEPSVSVVKTPHIPLLIGARCNRLETEQGTTIDELRFYASSGRVEKEATFGSLVDAVGASNIATFHGRIVAKQAFKGLSCVLSHTLENGLNYNWFEALFSGYPLLHNSDLVSAGYKYKSWDIMDGADLLWHVLRQHDDPQLSIQYNYVAKNYLATLSPQVLAPNYSALLSKLVGRGLG